MRFVISVIIGGISGWLAGCIMKSKLSKLGNIIIGILGGLVGSFLLSIIGIHGSGFIGSIIVSVIGACVLTAAGRAIRKK